MSGVSEFDNVFIIGEETPTCSKCGARTKMIVEYLEVATEILLSKDQNLITQVTQI